MIDFFATQIWSLPELWATFVQSKSQSTFLYLIVAFRLSKFVFGFSYLKVDPESFQEVPTCMIHHNKQIWFLPKQHFRFLLSWCQKHFISVEYRPGKHQQFRGPMKPETGSRFNSKKQACLSHKTMAAFHSSRYLSIFLIILKTDRKVNCYARFFAMFFFVWQNVPKTTYPYGLSWGTISNF